MPLFVKLLRVCVYFFFEFTAVTGKHIPTAPSFLQVNSHMNSGRCAPCLLLFIHAFDGFCGRFFPLGFERWSLDEPSHAVDELGIQ